MVILVDEAYIHRLKSPKYQLINRLWANMMKAVKRKLILMHVGVTCFNTFWSTKLMGQTLPKFCCWKKNNSFHVCEWAIEISRWWDQELDRAEPSVIISQQRRPGFLRAGQESVNNHCREGWLNGNIRILKAHNLKALDVWLFFTTSSSQHWSVMQMAQCLAQCVLSLITVLVWFVLIQFKGFFK